MFSEDYVMRQISIAVDALAKALGLKRAGHYSEARETIHHGLDILLGLPPNLVEGLDDESLIQTLSGEEGPDAHRLWLAAQLYSELGEIAKAEQRQGDAGADFLRALNLALVAALSSDPDTWPEELPGRINSLQSALAQSGVELPPQSAFDLYSFAVQSGHYAAAVQALDRLGGFEDLADDVAVLRRALLEDLQALDKEALEAYGMSPTDVGRLQARWEEI